MPRIPVHQSMTVTRVKAPIDVARRLVTEIVEGLGEFDSPVTSLIIDTDDRDRSFMKIVNAVRATQPRTAHQTLDEWEEETEREAAFNLGVALGELRQAMRTADVSRQRRH